MSTPGKNPGLRWFSEERSTPNDLKFLRCRWFAFSTDGPMEIKYLACHVLCQHVEVYIHRIAYTKSRLYSMKFILDIERTFVWVPFLR